MSSLGQLRTKESIEAAQRSIRNWLADYMNIDGISIDTRYDARQNIALVKFNYKDKTYEFRSTKQENCRLNMWGIARVMEYKVRSHIMEIEDFGTSMSPYLALGGGNNATSQFKTDISQNINAYATLGISNLASNEELKKHYREMIRRWHPDTVDSKSKEAFEKRLTEINEAWEAIKKERGIE